jgi:hypothetical protein
MLQPATSAIWAAVSNLLTIISWISWRCEAARLGAMSGSAFLIASLREVRYVFKPRVVIRLRSPCQFVAPDKAPSDIYQFSIALALHFGFQLLKDDADALRYSFSYSPRRSLNVAKSRDLDALAGVRNSPARPRSRCAAAASAGHVQLAGWRLNPARC